MTDTERLDFIFKSHAKVHKTKYGYWVEYTDENQDIQYQINSFDTPRQAIDAIMKEYNE